MMLSITIIYSYFLLASADFKSEFGQPFTGECVEKNEQRSNFGSHSGSLCPFEAKWTKTGYKSLQEWFPNSDKFLELYEGYLDAVYNSDYSYGFEEYHKMDFFICSIIMPPCLNVTEISSEEGEIRLVPPCRSLCSYAKPDNIPNCGENSRIYFEGADNIADVCWPFPCEEFPRPKDVNGSCVPPKGFTMSAFSLRDLYPLTDFDLLGDGGIWNGS
ncbi:uncharacterized protein LOC142350616 [Convolutriloba macropyga]|uniref:uncharacterized protein LOC142350616 n=1 Tax=Convolutriloba macropyga TaxID=536237 RepID=UPI003F52650B